MSVAFSSKDEEAIKRQIDVTVLDEFRGEISVEEFYEVDKCVEWIRENKYQKVALQLPDEYLRDAAELSVLLETEAKCQIYISGDTSYGSCCVDEITAEHVGSDAVIHFGHACLSPTNRLPVLYIFGKLPFAVENAASEFKSFVDKDSSVIVFYEVSYSYAMDKFRNHLKKDYRNVVFSQLKLPQENYPQWSEKETSTDDYSEITKCGRVFQISKNNQLSSYKMFYIGSENRTLMNLMLTFNENEFYSYNPATSKLRKETLDVNKYLRKRYYYIERAKDANLIGILVGTLGVTKYLDVLNHLRKIIQEAGKKAYTLVVGKLNAAKLANFSEIEVYVCVACPECSLVDSHDFYQPIVTPFEMEIALNKAREWTGHYITDFRELLPGAASYVPYESANDEMCGDVSLVTGRMRTVGSAPDVESSVCNEIVSRNKMTIANICEDGTSKTLAERSWKGLEQRLGETPVAELTQGKRGIASGYEDENVQESS